MEYFNRLLNANSSTLTALYEYDPFGNTLRATGPAAEANSLRLSTQFTDDVTRRVKYLYRDYDVGFGRWLSRGPIEEIGGINLYCLLHGDQVNIVDRFGLTPGIVGRDTLVILKKDFSQTFRACFKMGVTP